jgi:hypothetical protein
MHGIAYYGLGAADTQGSRGASTTGQAAHLSAAILPNCAAFP